MCGIAGKISFKDGEVEENTLKEMTDMISHRGPDGEGFWLNKDRNVGFGHRRLAIIDLSKNGAQPMSVEHVSITYNGELYNYIELRSQLIAKGYTFKTDTDTEVIIQAYIEYGYDCVQFFDGMFAFAIWDDNKKEFFGARDRFGEKPFYFYHDQNQFLFASEMKSIFKAGVLKRPSENMIYKYLTFDIVENPNNKLDTFYKNIYQIPPAHSVKINMSGQMDLKQYWDINYTKSIKITEEEAVYKFQNLFKSSISKRLRADVSVGSSFSGGLDSSSVVGTILKLNDSLNLNTFTARFNDKNYDEGRFIDHMEKSFTFSSNYCWPKEHLIIEELDKIFFHQEEPFGSTSIIAQWEVMKLAREKGVTVLLDGQGADETLAGYYKYFTPFLAELYKKNRSSFEHEKKAIEKNLGLENLLPNYFFLEMHLPKFKKNIGNYTRFFRLNKLTPDLSKSYRNLGLNESSPFNNLNTLNEFLYFDTFKYGLGKLLRFSDRNSMAHSREVRLPYLSHELVEFVFSLPSEFKMNKGWSKYILRKSMESSLPSEIVWRKDKKGFQAPKSWMKSNEVNLLVQESINNLKREKIIDKPILNNYWKYIMVNKLITS